MTEHRAPWRTSTEPVLASAVEPLDHDLTADVCVIGAGMAGLLCALELTERGRSVVIVERQAVAAGDTGATTAHLTALLDSRYRALSSMHGAEATRLIATSHQRAIAHLERVANAYGIECGFRRVSGFLCADTAEQAEALEGERQAALAAGIRCEIVHRAPLPVGKGPALHVPQQAQFQPLEFASGVVRALNLEGVPIYAPVTVQSFDFSSESEQVLLRTSDGQTIRASNVVVATGSPISDLAAIHTKQAAYRTYGIAAAIPELIPALCWDMDDPYHYVRSAIDAQTQSPVLIVGGEDHRVGQDSNNEQRFERLEGWLRDHFPKAGQMVSRWSGQVFESSDGLAFIGKDPGQERVFVITGESGNGMTYSALGAQLIADLLMGVESPYQKLYDPARKPSSLGAIGRFVRENINTVEQYTDWLGPADAESAAQIPRGEGAVLRRGLRRIAVYVDDLGRSHEVSATCPHLGGVVAWNSVEKSWDCPCHGSRFDCYGKVLAGPAVSDLEAVKSDPAKVGEAS